MINKRIRNDRIEIGRSTAPQANNHRVDQAQCLLLNQKDQEKSQSRSKISTNRTTSKIDQSKHGEMKKKTKEITTRNVKGKGILSITTINSNNMKKTIIRNIKTTKRMTTTEAKTILMKSRETRRTEQIKIGIRKLQK